MEWLTTLPAADTIALALGITFAPLSIAGALLAFAGYRGSLPTTLA